MKKPAAIPCEPMALLGRRRFIAAVTCIAGGAALASGRRARADAPLPHVDETDPTAAALGYKEDAANVDVTKFPGHLAAQHCGTCKFMLARNEAFGPCQIFVGKAVSAKGWCTAYATQA